jgi:prepilin-type N-terminal cleavage/methylation domain-containing protein
MTNDLSHPDSGFTLVETLIALMILAISSGLLLQSIALASSQIKSARHVLDAEQTAIAVLVEQSSSRAVDAIVEGVDQTSSLFWRYSRQTVRRKDESSELAAIDVIKVEVSTQKGAATIYQLETLSLGPQMP